MPAESPFNAKDHTTSVYESAIREFEAVSVSIVFENAKAELFGVPFRHEY
jgi:hypothetical protein